MACKQIIIVLALLIPTASMAGQELQYQCRGNYYEGIKLKPVSGNRIELISALVDYNDNEGIVPSQIMLKFYLKEKKEVFITVRELDYKYYYWMDKIYEKRQPWQIGFNNIFSWPTQRVVKKLKDLTIKKLGAIVRVGKSRPSMVEEVAPAILYKSDLPARINGYLFTLKTIGDAHLRYSIYKEGNSELIYTKQIQMQRGGRPFTFHWNAQNSKNGWYRLVVKGYLLYNNSTIDQIILFYHQPIVE